VADEPRTPSALEEESDAFRWLRRWAAAESVGAVVLAALGASVGALIIYWEPVVRDQAFDSAADTFLGVPEAELWIFLLVAQVAIWALLVVPLVQAITAVRAWRCLQALAAGAVVLTAIVAGLAKAGDRFGLEPPLPHFDEKLLALNVIGGLLVLGTVWTSWSVHGYAERALQLREGDADDAWLGDVRREAEAIGFTTRSAAEWFLELREQLHRALAVAGIIIGAAILAAGALRNAVLAYWSAPEQAEERTFYGLKLEQIPDLFPYEHVLLYGLLFSGLLALLFIPTFLRLHVLGTTIVDALEPAPALSEGDYLQAYRDRGELSKLLGLEVSSTTAFRAGVAILAPLGTSLLGSLLEL
jgi:predicted DNA-binding protein with PD1-like motif